MLLLLLLFLATIAPLSAQSGTDSKNTARESHAASGRILSDTFVARSLRGNLIGDDIERKVLVYLPPAYDTAPQRRYPVIYLLHGYGGRIESWDDGRIKNLHIKDDMNRLIAAREIGEMIIVMPDSRNRYAGSHYANSSVTGGWADAIARDLVEYIDRKYRTIASPGSRGLAGWAMGGVGALSLAMQYPRVYGAVYALSSGRMDFAHASPINDTAWKRVLELQRNHPEGYEFKIPEEAPLLRAVSFAAAFSPNPNRRPFMADLPVQLVDGELKFIPSVWQQWLAHDPVALVKTHAANLRALRAFQFDCDASDTPNAEANREFSRVLKVAGVPHVYEEYDPHDGDDPHYGHVGERIVMRMLPFFSSHLGR